MPAHHDILTFLLLMAVILAGAKAGAWLSLRAGQPAVLGELLVGVVLGPSVVNILSIPRFAGEALSTGVFLLANLGVVVLMFIAGLETDLDEMRRVGLVAVTAGVAGVVAPLLLVAAAALAFGLGGGRSVFMGVVAAATSVSITVQTLIELRQLNSKEGTAMLGAAVVDDIVALVVLALFLAASGVGGAMPGGIGITLVRMAAFFLIAVVLGRFLRTALAVARRAPVSEGLLSAALITLLIYAWASEALGGVAVITGAYLAGLIVGQAGFRHEVEQHLKALTYAMLAPIFFVSIGLQTNARSLHLSDLPFAALVIAAAVAGKVIGCGAGARLGGFAWPEALRVGVGMISRGEVGLIIAALGLQAGLLDARGFAIAVIMVLATTLVTPPLLRLSFPSGGVSEEEAIEEEFRDV